jgi:hypothetical protein
MSGVPGFIEENSTSALFHLPFRQRQHIGYPQLAPPFPQISRQHKGVGADFSPEGEKMAEISAHPIPLSGMQINPQQIIGGNPAAAVFVAGADPEGNFASLPLVNEKPIRREGGLT